MFVVTYQKESTHVSGSQPCLPDHPLAMTFQPDGSFTGTFGGITRPGTYDFVIDLTDGGDHDVHTVALHIQ